MQKLASYTNQLALDMFVNTADRNYILARLAYFSGLELDFLWLSLRSLEKYFKAILLMNGRSSKKFNHNLITLHTAVCGLDPRLSFGPLQDPQIKTVHWSHNSVEDFLARLNEDGSASNRYMTYGYAVTLQDLLKVDQLIWSVRRYCRPLKSMTDTPSGAVIEKDWISLLQANSQHWKLGPFLPLERVMQGKRGKLVQENFLCLNKPFAPDAEHNSSGDRLAGANSPISGWFEKLQNGDAEARKNAAEVLTWVLTNIQLGKDEKAELEKALRSF